MSFLTRDQITGRAGVRRFSSVKLSFGTLRIRSITERERNAFESAEVNDEGDVQVKEVGNRRARLVALCAVDSEDKPLFKSEEYGLLQEWDTQDLADAYADCRKHCGLDRKAKDREDLEKNSDPTLVGDSSSTKLAEPATS